MKKEDYIAVSIISKDLHFSNHLRNYLLSNKRHINILVNSFTDPSGCIPGLTNYDCNILIINYNKILVHSLSELKKENQHLFEKLKIIIDIPVHPENCSENFIQTLRQEFAASEEAIFTNDFSTIAKEINKEINSTRIWGFFTSKKFMVITLIALISAAIIYAQF